jgi:two-component system sensor histidine kinase KdpD
VSGIIIQKPHLRESSSAASDAAREASTIQQYFLAASVVVGTTLLAFLLQHLIGYRAVALIYLLVVVIMALFIGPGPTFFAAAASALVWDFCFLAPIANFLISNAEDAILFGMYFAVALVLGQLTSRIRAQERLERERERRSTALYLLTKELVEATERDDLVQNIVRHMGHAFNARVAMLLPDSKSSLGFQAHRASNYDISAREQRLVASIFEDDQKRVESAGDADSGTHFEPLISGGQILAVMGLNYESSHVNHQQRDLLAAFSQQIALALDRQRLREESQKSKLLAESERLSKALLNSMSHEIRTPLAAIKAAAGTLGEVDEPRLSGTQRAMVDEIQEATERLDNLVGKVLDITRLESGMVRPKPKPCDLNDLVHVAVRDTRKELGHHRVEVEMPPGLPLITADYVLLQEAVKNLLSNAACHTPAGTFIEVKGRIREKELVLTVADRGPGIAPNDMPRIFDKFYRGPGAPTGGTGLGLAVVKGFVEACGGQVRAENRVGGGALFTIRMPIGQTQPGLVPQ